MISAIILFVSIPVWDDGQIECSPLNNLIPASSANFSASLSTGTSKHRMQAISCAFSSCGMTRLTSFLCTGPMLIPETGILLSSRKESRASREPRVLAWTCTPTCVLEMRLSKSSKGFMISSIKSSSSSSGPHTRSLEPAIALSRSGATTLTPFAALTSLLWTYCD